MRTLIIILSFLLATITLHAAPIDGIRIESNDRPILVYVDGQQMCLPTTSCFIANLRNGSYRIEVYESRFTGPSERLWKGERLYSQQVSYSGRGVKDIFVESRERPGYDRPGVRPNRPDDDYDYRPSDRVMSRSSFEQFFNLYKNEPFESGRKKLLEAAMVNNDFTTAQCKKLVDFHTFASEKKKMIKLMYPRIVDKENLFLVIETLTFSSDKNEIYEFIKNDSRRR